MTTELREYLDATARCAEQCEGMLQSEREKRQALLAGGGSRLESVIKQQQAAVMSLEVLERKRLGAQRAAGFPEGATGDEIAASLADEAAKSELTALLRRLRAAAKELREHNRTAIEIAEKQLQFLGRANDGPTYRPGQQPGQNWNGGTSFEQKI